MSSIASLRNVTKRYTRGNQTVEVLHQLNLEIPAAQFLALMGPSGSGKSTLLNLMGGLDKSSDGEIVVAGERIDQLTGNQLASWRARHVGFIFQFYNLMPMLSAERNVELPLLLTKLSGAQRSRNVAAALEIVGLETHAKHRPSEMSGGQQQRVAIARALVTDPTIFMCDEPTGDLDRAAADNILGLLKMLNEERRKTIIMVTHDPRAAAYAGRVLSMDKGQLISSSEKEAA